MELLTAAAKAISSKIPRKSLTRDPSLMDKKKRRKSELRQVLAGVCTSMRAGLDAAAQLVSEW
jgi:hypothetical protein